MSAGAAAAAGRKNVKRKPGAKRKKKVTVRWKRLLPLLGAMLAVMAVAAYFVNLYMEKRTYPLVYAREITECAGEFGLDAYLVAAVMNTESGGDPAAVSHAGATGLMQIMPTTGEWIAGKLDIGDYTEAMLVNATVNLRMGCWYIDYLLDRYQNTDNALAAYNAGPGNVDKWLADARYSENGVLTDIPFGETKEYVRRVNAAWTMYKELYEGELGE